MILVLSCVETLRKVKPLNEYYGKSSKCVRRKLR